MIRIDNGDVDVPWDIIRKRVKQKTDAKVIRRFRFSKMELEIISCDCNGDRVFWFGYKR